MPLDIIYLRVIEGKRQIQRQFSFLVCYVRVFMFAGVRACLRAYVLVCACVCLCVLVCACVCLCVLVCACVCLCVCS